MKSGHVYIVQMLGTPFYKIGVTTQADPLKRIKGGETFAPLGLRIVRLIESVYPHKLEKELHADFSLKRKKGEWFELDDEDLKFIQQKYSVSDDKISLLISELLPLYKNNKELLYSALKRLKENKMMVQNGKNRNEELVIQSAKEFFNGVDFFSGQLSEIIKEKFNISIDSKVTGKILVKHYKPTRKNFLGCTRNVYNTKIKA